MQRKTTSLKIDPKIWKEAKIHCVKKEIKISEYIEELIRENITK